MMIDDAPTTFVDTDVVIPYLSGHDPDLMARAQSIIDVDARRVISVTVLLETAWVLDRTFRYRPRDIAAAIHGFLSRANIMVAELPKETVMTMIGRWREGRIGSIGDAMVAASMATYEAERIYSFDRRFPRDLGWEVLGGPVTRPAIG
jgi:predicted nucleic acid-binding protein